MRQLHIIYGENKKDINRISEKLQENKFRIMQTSDNFILLKKRRYGNMVIQLGILFLALFMFYPLILVNLAYFTYAYLFRSPNVLVTSETQSDNGDELEFENIEDVLKQSNTTL